MDSHEITHNPKPVSSTKKPGRPRKYAGGWLSVKNHLVKQIKLRTNVYTRWCRLKGSKQHSEFANILLDLYESVENSKNAFSAAQQCCISPVEVMSTTTSIQPTMLEEKMVDLPVSAECYEDAEYVLATLSQATSQNINVPCDKQTNEKMKFLESNPTNSTCLQFASAAGILPIHPSELTQNKTTTTKTLDIVKQIPCGIMVIDENNTQVNPFSGSSGTKPQILTAHTENATNAPTQPPTNVTLSSARTAIATLEVSMETVHSSEFKPSELAVAKIISSLSDSFQKSSDSLESDNPGKFIGQMQEGIPLESESQRKENSLCRNSCFHCSTTVQNYTQGNSRKRLGTSEIRHMTTQFTTESLNARGSRTVSTQTVFHNFMVSRQTEIDHALFRRSIQTQYWPSPLWTEFSNYHPEVIYNIDLHEQPEFPQRFRLFRKSGKLYSTLFGSRFELQRKPGMRCVIVSEFGGPEVLRLLSSIPTPKPVGRQVLVNVKAAGVNPVDTYIRSGTFHLSPKLPYTPGQDGAGIIQQVGGDVTKVKKGDRIWFCGASTGSYGEYCIVEEENVGVLPISHTFEDGAMLGIPYLTAYKALIQRGKLQRGETVFIHGASGGVGTAAIQICKSYGVRVIGTAGSEEGIALLKNMGVDSVYNHREPGYLDEVKKNETKIDVILEMLANVNLNLDLQLLKRCTGRVVIVGCRGPVEINPRSIMSNEVSVTGVNTLSSSPEEKAEQMHYINEGLKNGWVTPVLWKTIELEKAKDAHREIIENKGAKGQIVLKINASLNSAEYVPDEL